MTNQLHLSTWCLEVRCEVGNIKLVAKWILDPGCEVGKVWLVVSVISYPSYLYQTRLNVNVHVQ